MEHVDHSPLKKARQVNLDGTFYGTFAEIGAGQEVARYFFLAGRASQTIAKSISAYDMTVSDSVYGKASRYVCEERVLKMLDHEYELLVQRLDQQRGEKTRFFALADTVATSSHGEPNSRCHGWMGIRYQTKPRGPAHQIILHVRMKDRLRLQQQEALGILGVNLTHLAYETPRSRAEVVDRLIESLGPERLEINLIRLDGPENHFLDDRLVNLEMLKKGVTEAVLFDEAGRLANPSDVFFKKPILIQRGTFRPVTRTNLSLMTKGAEQFARDLGSSKPEVIFELTMNSLTQEGQIKEEDFLQRVDTLSALGHKVLLSKFNLFFQVKSFLRTYTDQPIALIVGAGLLEKLFQPPFYESLPGGILEGFSRLFDHQTRLLVFPFKTQNLCQTAHTVHMKGPTEHLYQYFLTQGWIQDLAGCDDVDTSVHSQDVRTLLERDDKQWESLVPNQVRDLIRKKGFFGLKTR